MTYLISKEQVKPWLRKLIKRGILVAPKELKGGDVAFKETFSTDGILLDYKQPMYSVKSFFLPQEETLFTFKDRSVDSLEDVYDEYPRVFFGLRPCDLRAVSQADRFFDENYRDPYYAQRRKRNLLIGIGCNSPENHCFCHAMGIGPFYSDKADIFMVDLGDKFMTTGQTPKGNAAINDYFYFFTEANDDNKKEVAIKASAAMDKLKSNLQVNGDNTYDIMAKGEEFWAEQSAKCFSCGSCSYVCPFCFCYNVVDRENKEQQGKRIRTWDSCIFEGFSRMAGRHNMLRKKQERLKKRFAHKLEQYPKTYGILGCSGCGRCSLTCLGNISMIDMVKKLTREEG